jgi:hypothetical protein
MKKTILLIFSLCVTMILQATNPTNLSVVSNAGGLSTAITNAGGNLSTVTTLTVMGTIDARDFVTLRDSMLILSTLDISGVNIIAYTGTGGTQGSSNYTYQANSIPQYAFCNTSTYTGKTSLTNIYLPTTATSIGDEAFMLCSGLTSIMIPSLVTSIGIDTFWNCTNLNSVNISSSVTSIGSGAFGSCTSLTSVFIPSSVISIGDGAFANCNNLTSVNLPSSLTSLGNGTFYECTNLTSINIPSSITFIGSSVFQYCSNLKSLTIPSSITSIGYWAFGDCSSLTSITIPSSVTSMECYAFNGCSGVTSIYAYSTTPLDLISATSAFSGINTTTCTLYVPENSISLYKIANQWEDFYNIVGMINTGISTEKVNPIGFYPNPVTEGFYINGLEGTGALTILDLNAKILLTKQVTGNEYISISSFPKGLYVVKISTDGKIIEDKIIKE